ncbi:MAG TPA: hypothetical protein VJ945_09150, partial [Flavobacteriaceae bacterium]|nr:hypothetical protein [Flavobacteriaceae bacterium]
MTIIDYLSKGPHEFFKEKQGNIVKYTEPIPFAASILFIVTTLTLSVNNFLTNGSLINHENENFYKFSMLSIEKAVAISLTGNIAINLFIVFIIQTSFAMISEKISIKNNIESVCYNCSFAIFNLIVSGIVVF